MKHTSRITLSVGVPLALAVALVALLLIGGTATAQVESGDDVNVAHATVRGIHGQILGHAVFTETPGGAVQIRAEFAGFDPIAGGHGIHIHEVGECVPPFTSAGGHFNPTGAEHGLENPQGPHAGDLPNLQLFANGTALYVATTDRITLGEGARSIFDANGSALVIHAGEDDQMTSPSGNSGDRIACGVIMRGPLGGTQEAIVPAPPTAQPVATAVTTMAPPQPAATATPAPPAVPAAGTETGADVSAAIAQLRSLNGTVLGEAIFAETETGAVQIRLAAGGFAPIASGHGIHIHEVGECVPPFTSAGGHFNPTGAEHGLENPQGPHAGDLPNLQIFANGATLYVATTDRITLDPGPRSIFDANGSALVIHAGEDDQMTSPSGNSGDRIACGVIRPVAPGALPAVN